MSITTFAGTEASWTCDQFTLQSTPKLSIESNINVPLGGTMGYAQIFGAKVEPVQGSGFIRSEDDATLKTATDSFVKTIGTIGTLNYRGTDYTNIFINDIKIGAPTNIGGTFTGVRSSISITFTALGTDDT